MKARELMIGDWVVYNGDVDYSSPIKIEGMDEAIDMLVTNDREDVGFDGIWPIPLSEEILDRNFKPSNHEGDYPYAVKTYYIDECSENNDYDLILCEDNQCTLTDHVFITIKYVHELQHLLKVCGIEKEIQL